MLRGVTLVFAVALVPALGSAAGCKDSTPPDLSKPASGGSSAPVPQKLVTTAGPPDKDPNLDRFPLSDEEIQKIVNPAAATEYAGPTGGVEGIVKVIGDPPAMRTFRDAPKECEGATTVHAPVYRKGPGGELIGAMVAVIGYDGYVRPSREDKIVTIRNCSIDPPAIDLSLGQRLLLANGDDIPYTPMMPGKMYVKRLSLKGHSPPPLHFTSPGVYAISWLVDALPGVADVPTATVFVLPNAFHWVTQADGKFRFTGVPVGKARVTSSHLGLPEAAKDVEIKAGAIASVELVMAYKKPAPAASSGKPVPKSSIH